MTNCNRHGREKMDCWDCAANAERTSMAIMLEIGAKDYEKKIKRALKKGVITHTKALLDTQWVEAYRAAARAIREGTF